MLFHGETSIEQVLHQDNHLGINTIPPLQLDILLHVILVEC